MAPRGVTERLFRFGTGNLSTTTVAFSPSGATAYALVGETGMVVPINTSNFSKTASFASGVTGPIDDAVTPDGKSLVVVGGTSGTVSVISTSSTATKKTVKVGSGPNALAILPDSLYAYVVNQADGTVSVVSLASTPTVIKTISLPGCTTASYVAAAPNGNTVYVTCAGNYKLWPITVATNTPAATGIAIPQGGCLGAGCLRQVAITPNGTTAYVPSGNYVYPVTLSSQTVGSGIFLNNSGTSVAISPDGAYVLVGLNNNGCACFTDAVWAIQVSTNTIVDTFSSGADEHYSIAFKPITTPQITSPPLPPGKRGVMYTTTLTAEFGSLPYTWKVVPGSGKLPQGLKLNKHTGAISGTPKNRATSSTFTVQVRDKKNKTLHLRPQSSTQVFSISIS